MSLTNAALTTISGTNCRRLSRKYSFYEDSEDEDSEEEDVTERVEDHALLLRHIYLILDKMRRRVMGHLLIVQVALFVVCVVLSAMVFMPLSLVTQGFRGQCLLFSDISLEWNDNDTVSVDLAVTRYGSQKDCEVPTFITVSVCVACIIVSWFYLCNIFSASHEDKTASSRVQLPALLVFIALFISTIVAASKITDGFDVWCHNIVDNVPFGSKRHLKCADFENLKWTNSINSYMFYTRYVIAEVSCWLLCVSLFILCCVTCLGCYQVYRAVDMLNTSDLTMSLTLAESEDGSLILTKTKEGGKKLKEQPDVENSGQDYFSSLEDQILSSKDQEQVQGPKRLLQTEATIHSESEAAAFTANGEYENSSSGDQSRDNYLSASDSQPAERFSESEKVAINTADGDEVSTLPYSHSRGHGPRSQNEATPNPSSTDSSACHNEREAFAKNGSVGVGYGAVNLYQ